MQPFVTIYVVTHKRPHLLSRALRSLLCQSNPHWKARVVNDAPDDDRVSEVIKGIGDDRIQLHTPVVKRGGAANFNLAFKESSTPFASILEDDNWWEPDFLRVMLAALEETPNAELACGNERIWQESADGKWLDTGWVIWPEQKDSLYATSFETACGSAKICNSSMLFRTRHSAEWQTPDDIPVDVTEHFRERLVPSPIRLVGVPLVNYSETLQTHRSKTGTTWGDYQSLLIGSCFYSLPPTVRRKFARRLWDLVGTKPSPRATSLLTTSLAVREASCLWGTSSVSQRVRFLATLLRRMRGVCHSLSVKQRLRSHWDFLCQSAFNKGLESHSVSLSFPP